MPCHLDCFTLLYTNREKQEIMKTFEVKYEFNGSIQKTILLLEDVYQLRMFIPDSAVVISIKIK